MRSSESFEPTTLLLVIALVLAVIVAGLVFLLVIRSGQVNVPAAPANLPVTATPGSVAVATEQLGPAPTGTAQAPTATPSANYQVIYSSVGVREGPGRGFHAITFLYDGDQIVPLGTNSDGTWYRIELDDGTEGWVAANVVEPLGEPLQEVPTVAASATPVATAAPSGPYGALALSRIAYENDTVIVRGSTDLPDGSQLLLYLRLADEPASGPPSSTARVSGGAFSTSFTPDLTGLASDSLALEVRFFPQEQAPEVARLVGSSGQNLSGPHVQQSPSAGGSILSLVAPLDAPPDEALTTLPDPAAYGADTPERAFAEFLAAWKDSDWQGMMQFTQKTWQSVDDDPLSTLQSRFASRELRGAEIVDKSVYEEEWVELVVTLSYEVQGQLEKATFGVVVVREIAPFEQSVAGDWGVNPLSVLEER